MGQEQLYTLAKELATFVNKLVNIPFVSEKEEQVIFELIINKVISLIGGETEDKVHPKR